jgi:hypothetical protein
MRGSRGGDGAGHKEEEPREEEEEARVWWGSVCVHTGAWVSAKIRNWKAGVYSNLCLQSAKLQTVQNLRCLGVLWFMLLLFS